MEDSALPGPRATPSTRVRRHTDYSVNSNSLEREQTVLGPTLSRSNTALVGRVGKWSYEDIRKRSSTDASTGHSQILQLRLSDVVIENASPSLDGCGEHKTEKRRSRTLVKKRQPWDKAPRTSVGDVRKL